MAKKLSGGGITSNKLSQKREATREQPRVRAASPAGVSQLGQKVANPQAFEPVHQGPSFQKVKFGNELATNVGAGGPGKGRKVLPAGTQGKH
jgi:hypothetical protein